MKNLSAKIACVLVILACFAPAVYTASQIISFTA